MKLTIGCDISIIYLGFDLSFPLTNNRMASHSNKKFVKEINKLWETLVEQQIESLMARQVSYLLCLERRCI